MQQSLIPKLLSTMVWSGLTTAVTVTDRPLGALPMTSTWSYGAAVVAPSGNELVHDTVADTTPETTPSRRYLIRAAIVVPRADPHGDDAGATLRTRTTPARRWLR